MGRKKKAGGTKADGGAGPAQSAPRELALAVDVVVLTAQHGELLVLLVRRGTPPHEGALALPGGFVGAEEALEDAAERELREETGLALEPSHIEQLGAYGAPDRDTRPDRRVVTVAYLAIQPDAPQPTAGTDAAAAQWSAVGPVLTGAQALAFDHAAIVGDAVDRLRHELEHTAVATAFFRDAFTEAQLRSVYEAVWGSRRGEAVGLDAPNFHRSIATMSPPMVERVPNAWAATGGRPAALYRPSGHVREGGPATPLERPLPRPRDAAFKRRVY